jgi:SAM-dependent methyltransferase
MSKSEFSLTWWLRRFLSRRTGAVRSAAELAAQKADIEKIYGPWTAHNCELSEGLWSMRAKSVNFDEKTRRCLRIAGDFFGSNLSGLRVLDLGAGEGGLSLEFAARGASVVCVEGRQMNIAKAEFAASALGLEIDFRCQDVRLIPKEERYDLVLCFGLLYHLDARSAIQLVETIGGVTQRLLILDTHFSLAAPEEIDLDGRTYRGHLVREYAVETTAEEKTALPWASLDNDSSFWLSKPSLLNLLARVGFNTVYEVSSPLVFDYWNRQTDARIRYRDRSTFVAARSNATPILTATAVNSVEPRTVPEDLEEQLITYLSLL